jgi:predicted ATPase
MKIRFVSNHRALTEFVWSDVPELVVLTGKNGVGKSQALVALYNYFCGDRNPSL